MPATFSREFHVDRIYLDNAATSWPKPAAVYAAVDRYQRELGAPAGRSAYAEAGEVEAAIRTARKDVAALIGAKEPRQVVFTFNGTDSLNVAIHGMLRPGGHVITSAAEHNSVLRPLRHWEDRGDIEVTRVACDAQGVIDPDDVRRSIKQETALIALVHASNVTGAIQPLAEVGAAARERGVCFLVDAAQSLGHLPLNVEELSADLLAAPGHKGLLGPLGTGVLYIRPGVEERLASFRQGGTGSRSEQDRQPPDMPDKFESGNHNTPGLLGLGAAAAYLRERGVDSLRDHEAQLTRRLIEGLAAIGGATIYGPKDASRQVGVVSINIAGVDCQEVAAMLDASCRIQVRSGLHCAPHMHKSLDTLCSGGTVRFSIGVFNTAEHVDAAVEAVGQVAESL